MSELALKLIAENKARQARGEDARMLDLGNCGLTEVPEEVGELVWLEELSFARQRDFLTGQRDFLIGSKSQGTTNAGQMNDIIFIPKSFGQLKNLKALWLNGYDDYYNTECSFSITDISPLAELTNLIFLDLSNNDFLSDLSPLKNLKKLEFLNLSCATHVSDLSPLKDLINLKILHFDYYTKVSELAPLSGLINLQEIDFHQTLVADLTPIIPLLKRGVKINYGSCPITIPPPEIVKRGNAAILNYFAEREKAQFQNTEIKLILVGNSTVGKTSLSRFLRERTYQSGETTTHGIRNDRWQPTGRNLQVNLWDFGGQEYYHATHRLFLSHNAVYALVWDAQTDKGGYCETPVHFDNDPEPIFLQLEHSPQKWWLQNIQHFTRESNPRVPVMMVQNKCARDGIQRVSSDFEKPPFKMHAAWLDNHIDLEAAAEHLTNPQQETRKWWRSFEDFEERLLDKLESQLTHYEFAVYHRDIRDKVRRLAEAGKTDLPYSEFESLCRGIEEDAKMDLVQIYLRDITGDILYYPHNQRLKERIFLHPAWVCDSIYQILSQEVQLQNGVFGVDWVRKTLQCDEANALDFVELMREFELVFDDCDESGNPTGQLVAPQYLPDTCSKSQYLEGLKADKILTHVFTLWFPDFLPKSHIARFVANWGNKAEGRIFWKNGLLFKTEDCKALVERIGEDKIRVELQANQPKRAEAMRRIFQSFLHLEDGQAGFAVSLDGKDFVWWRDAQDAMQSQARQVKTFVPEGTAQFIDLQPFFILQKPTMTAKKIFISYSHKDEDAMKELDKFLGPLERKGDISIWTDRKILPGQNWKEKILSNLQDADLTLLLVSANFLDSDFINEEEIPRAFQRMNEHGKHVVPIILNYCMWDITSLGTLQATPKDGRPIADFPNPAQAWHEVAKGILALLNA